MKRVITVLLLSGLAFSQSIRLSDIDNITNQQLDKIILVQSPLHIRIERTCKRDNRTKEDVKNIIKNQIKDAEAIKYADYIIKNNNKLLLPKIIQLHEVLSNL